METINIQAREEGSFMIIDNYSANRPEWKKRNPTYEQLQTGDLFLSFLKPPKAVVIGLIKDIPGIRGICFGNLNGYAPLLYFEDADVKPMPMRGLAGLAQQDWMQLMSGCLKNPDFNHDKIKRILERANEYLHSKIPIYTGWNHIQTRFFETHRDEIGNFSDEKLRDF